MAAVRDYVCPGESYAISPAVHRARRAAGHAACRECPFRNDGRAEDGRAEDRSSIVDGPLERLITDDGIRGVARNEVDERLATRLAAALADQLWYDALTAGSSPPPAGFPVVVGYDDRRWSMALAVAAGAALRRAGCETIDVGLVTGPEFRFAVAHLDAAGGLYATGAGGGPAVAGLDVARAAGRPLSKGGGLDARVDHAETSSGRPTRRGGRRREFRTGLPYEAGLRRHLESLAGVHGVVGTPSPLLRNRLARIAGETGAAISPVGLPLRSRSPDGRDEAGEAAIAARVVASGAAFGLWIDDDATGCIAVDETGTALPPAALACVLLADARTERPGAAVVADWTLIDGEALHLDGEPPVGSNGTAEAMFVSMNDHPAAAGADSRGRFWLPGPPATCDALITLARLARVLSKSASPLSALVREIAATTTRSARV